MKSIPIAAVLIGILTISVLGEDQPTIVLHAVKIVKTEAYRAFILEDDYGYVVLNDGTKDAPKPRYILGSQSEGTVIHYTAKKEFLAAVAKIPEGATLREYAKCLAPLSWGLNEEQLVYKDVSKIAKEKGIKFIEDSKLHCNCPSSIYKREPVEQGGAEQPATALQSKSKGNKNTKQESKVRPQ